MSYLATGRGLWHTGTSLRRSETALLSRTHLVSLLLGTCLLCLSLGCLGYAVGADHLHQQRAQSLAPVPCDMQQASLLYRFGGFTQVGNRPVTVVVLSPLSDDEPLPPGLRTWPQPGEAVVSPALAADLTGDLTDLFGPVSATIDYQGLEVPQERRVYLRPAAASLNPQAMEPVCGFGADSDEGAYRGSGILYAAPLSDVLLLITGVLLVPATACLVIAASVRGEENRRRTTALVVCGLRRRQLALIDLAEIWPGVLSGLALAACATAAAMIWDIHLPWLDSWFPAQDTRTLAFLIVPGVVSAGIVSTSVVLAVRACSRQPAVPPRHPIPRVSWFVILVAGFALAIWFPVWMPESSYKFILYVLGILLVAMALPGLLLALSSLTGRAVARAGIRYSRAGLLVAGRHLTALTRSSRFLGLGIALVLLCGGQIQLWAASLSPQYYDAVSLLQRLGEKVVAVEHLEAARAPETLLSDLPEGTTLISVSVPDAPRPDIEPVPEVRAPCHLLQSWGQGCQASTISTTELLAAAPVLESISEVSYTSTVSLASADAAETIASPPRTGSIYMVSTTGQDLRLRDIERLVHATAPGVQVISGPQNWLTAGEVVYLRSLWTMTLGAVGTACLTTVLGLALAHDSARTAQHLAPVGVIAGATSVPATAARWRAVVIVALSGLVATLLYIVLPAGMSRSVIDTQGVVFRPSGLYVGLCLAATLLTCLLSGWSASAASTAAARRWRP